MSTRKSTQKRVMKAKSTLRKRTTRLPQKRLRKVSTLTKPGLLPQRKTLRKSEKECRCIILNFGMLWKIDNSIEKVTVHDFLL